MSQRPKRDLLQIRNGSCMKVNWMQKLSIVEMCRNSSQFSLLRAMRWIRKIGRNIPKFSTWLRRLCLLDEGKNTIWHSFTLQCMLLSHTRRKIAGLQVLGVSESWLFERQNLACESNAKLFFQLLMLSHRLWKSHKFHFHAPWEMIWSNGIFIFSLSRLLHDVNARFTFLPSLVLAHARGEWWRWKRYNLKMPLLARTYKMWCAIIMKKCSRKMSEERD